ncbi:MAG TPA: glycosyltransferase [Vicinamibacterales bacterium]|nr:glycosyltransferase [Vicinamibacterales bacterium]
MTITYISWAANCSRSDHTARELGGVSHMVYWPSLGSRPLTVWLKYLGQAARTWRILTAERPAAAFVMTPPLFAPLVAWAFCMTHRCSLVIDAHTAAFLDPRWRYLQWLQFWLCRRAVTTIVHNEHLKTLVERHGGHATLVSDIPARFVQVEPYPLPRGVNIAVVSSFNSDEPVANILDAARKLPDVQFHVTGDPAFLEQAHKNTLPVNVRLTGFLSTGQYASLITDADAVMTLTTRDHTMLRGAWEAVYQGTPVVISDWSILRESFDAGAVHVDNTVQGIVTGIERLRRDLPRYRAEVLQLRERKERRWADVREALRARIGA